MIIRIIFLLFISGAIYAQESALQYELNLTIANDAFNVTISNIDLSDNDRVFSFVSFAPGVHQPLDFGRFVKLFKEKEKNGTELITNKISINDFSILEPQKVSKIVYEIDDSFDMSTGHHPIYPMSGTGITNNYTIVNSHGVFGYFQNLKNKPIELSIKLNGIPKVGTALNKNEEGVYLVDSYYHLADSPILIGNDLTYSSTIIGEIKVEAFVHSPVDDLNAEIVLKEATPILNAAVDFIEYAPVDRYTFLMYFNNDEDVENMPVLHFGGALEHSYSSTYALSGNSGTLQYLKNTIAHEFMHILSPLHLRSEVLANVDYSRPVSEDQHVWLYEGVTEWASFVMQIRNGNLNFEEYLQYLSEKIHRSKNYSDEYSLTRISEEWSTAEGGKQYGNIYQLGAITAAMLDIKLIELSDGKKGLRDVYLELIKKYGKSHPFDNGTFFDELVAITYPEIQEFIDRHIKNNTPFNFEEEVAAVGLKYYPKRENPENLPTMGIIIGPNSEGEGIIASLLDEYTGSLLQVGDVIISINSIELIDMESYMKIMKSVEERSVGEQYEIEISRKGEKMLLKETLVPKYDYFIFELNPDATKKAKFLRRLLLTNN